MKYIKKIMPNGLSFLLARMPERESVSIGVWIAAGGRYESARLSGISHFLEHMVFKGTRTRTNRQIKESIEGIGGSLNGFTDEEMTCYYAKVPRKFVGLGLDILGDMAMDPRVSRREIDKERTVIFEEIKMYKDHPDQHVHQLLGALLWPDHQLGRPLIGTENTLRAMGRKEILDYKKALYTPANIAVCICGDIEEPALTRMVKKRFKGDGGCRGRFDPFKGRLKDRFDICTRGTEQTHLNIGFHCVSRFHEDRYAAKLLHVIMGGNMSSRLFHEVREVKGLAYEIATGVKSYIDTGAFIINAGVDNRKVLPAVDVVCRELRRIKRKRVGAQELRRAKDFYKGQLGMGLEDTLHHMLWAGEKVITGDEVSRASDIIRRVEKVTAADITRLARNVFTMENVCLAAIGPFGKKDASALKERLVI